jgi:hypothetical protein
MKNVFKWVLLLSTIVFLSSCADVTSIQDCVTVEPYGFWNGLWHGFVAPIQLLRKYF